MPDRAVVDEHKHRYRYQIGVSGYWVECDAKEALVVYPDGHEETYRGILIGDPQPRALVALSEDRQWLVVLERNGEWRLRERDDDEHYVTHDPEDGAGGWVLDTGQDAQTVLAEFLAGRES